MRLRVASSTLIVLLLSCSGRDVPRPAAHTPVFLISIDTLRSDHLPAYGYTGVQTPHIDTFRKDSILFERAYSHMPLTLPSHATMLTGMLPADTGLRDNIGFTLRPDATTIGEVLKKNGYVTGAAVSAYVMRHQSGISRGFDFYDDDVGSEKWNAAISAIQRNGSDTVKVAREWIGAQAGKPVFFLLHLYEPHTGYIPPEPYKSRYANPYDGEIAYVDAIFGDFIQFLKDRDLYDRSLILFVSDHGEGLGDHGEDEHGIFVYREALQIPMIVKFPKSKLAGRSVSEPVQLVDLFPTIVEQTAVKVDSARLQGRSLLSPVRGDTAERAIYSESYYARFHFGWSDMHSLIQGSKHLIKAPRSELYDLVSDPGEKRDILADNRRTYVALNRAIEPLIKAADAPQQIDPEEASKLAALGYLGSTVTVAPGEVLPDPKDKIVAFRQLREAFKIFRDGELEKALVAFDALLKDNHRMLDLWDIKARTLGRLGRYDEAIAAAKEGLKISPQSHHLALMIANLALEDGKYEEAEKHADLALKNYPGEARELLARIALARGDLNRAREQANIALKSGDDRAWAYVTLARVEKESKNYAAALVHADKALQTLNEKKKPALSKLNFLRGDLLARLERNQEAEAAFREEIRLFPEDAPSYRNLILLLVTEGRLEEATALIYDLEKASPTPPAYAAISQTLKVVGDEQGARFWALRGLRRYPEDRTLRRLAS